MPHGAAAAARTRAELKEYRNSKITPPETVAAGANHWEKSEGKAMQLELREAPFKHTQL